MSAVPSGLNSTDALKNKIKETAHWWEMILPLACFDVPSGKAHLAPSLDYLCLDTFTESSLGR